MNYTYATVIINATDQSKAQEEYPNYFFNSASVDGKSPATAYYTSGPFANDELDNIVNETDWGSNVYFGNDFQYAITKHGLQMITEEINMEKP